MNRENGTANIQNFTAFKSIDTSHDICGSSPVGDRLFVCTDRVSTSDYGLNSLRR